MTTGRSRRQLVAPLLLAVATIACASSSAFHQGQKAEKREDYTQAVLQYSRAVKLNPDNLGYRKSLQRARLRASEERAFASRRLAARGLMKEAVEELQLAFDLMPDSQPLAEELAELKKRAQKPPVPRKSDGEREAGRESGLPGLELPPAAREPLGLSFHGASLRDTYQALGKAVGVNFVFDPQFQDTAIDLDLKSVPFPDALRALAQVGHTFHVVAGTHIVTVVPDNANKRKEYEQQVVRTFFLVNADPKAAVDLLRIALGARRVAPVVDANAVTMTDSPDKIAAAERILDSIDKRRAEVEVEVELLEVNRNRLLEYGIEITSALPGVSGVAGAIFPRSQPPLTLEDKPYAKENLLVTALPGVIYRLLKNDSATRLLANPRLRTSEGLTAQARFGDQIPVPVTTFTPISTGAINSQPITSFEYKNVGVNIDLTPRVHDGNEVTLDLKLDVSSLAASLDVAGVQGLPTFNSRVVTSRLRLRDGETTVLAGLISDIERKSLSGIPGLADVPILGRIFSRNRKEISQTDIVMTLRPHIVIPPEITDADRRAFQLSNDNAPLVYESTSPGTGGGSSSRPVEAPRVEPIRPLPPAVTPAPPLPTR